MDKELFTCRLKSPMLAEKCGPRRSDAIFKRLSFPITLCDNFNYYMQYETFCVSEKFLIFLQANLIPGNLVMKCKALVEYPDTKK